jgi:hypothetical protein
VKTGLGDDLFCASPSTIRGRGIGGREIARITGKGDRCDRGPVAGRAGPARTIEDASDLGFVDTLELDGAETSEHESKAALFPSSRREEDRPSLVGIDIAWEDDSSSGNRDLPRAKGSGCNRSSVG